MSIIKPIYVMNEEGLSELERKAVLEGTEDVLKIAGVEDRIKIEDLGAWRHEEYQNKGGSLIPYRSVDWYIQKGREASRNKTKLDASTLLDLLVSSDPPFQKYRILVLKSNIGILDIYSVVGLANHWGPGIALSTNRFKDLDEETKIGCIKTATMHEVGHIFGLVPEERTGADYTHCENKCVMRSWLSSPDDFTKATNDRLEYGPFCEPCETQLKEHFKETPSTGGKPKIIRYTRRR